MNCTFVTYLGTDSFLPGVLALNQGITKIMVYWCLLLKTSLKKALIFSRQKD
ncbi:hypothetical protein JN11_01689 [Mucilaginibacter frigoritolerans]|uniref:Uncharacterized protein n=1 Tax=Mucilaginibacter frigoritolerans TaxID=652788 RepID=A0A562U6Y6_9SPHI|nr:hypothetical protein JN11_01689 [Mucilaginibacter frigoritolerans]